MLALGSSGMDEKEISRLSIDLKQRSDLVTNFADYKVLINFINSNILTKNETKNNIESLNNSKSFWRFIFIGLYLIGTGMLIYVTDWRRNSLFPLTKTGNKA